MGKWLLLLAVVAGFFWWLRQRAQRSNRPAAPAQPVASTRPATTQPMVVCHHCGLHLPRGDALPDNRGIEGDATPRRWYCSTEHRDAAESAAQAPSKR